MDDTFSTTRRRAVREDVVINRAGQNAARPLTQKLTAWQQAATRLGAKIEYARGKKQSTDAYRAEIDDLVQQMNTALESWRAGLTDDDASGHVVDAERSAQTLLELLGSLRHRA